MKSATPEHWSKDYVEHLRTVHFALITVCLGLILILSSTRYDPRAAATQMAEVIQINAVWPREELTDSSSLTKTVTLSQAKAADWVPTVFAGVVKANGKAVSFLLSSPNLFECLPRPEVYAQVVSHTWPTNIESFKRRWNLFTLAALRLDSIDKIGVDGEIVDSDEPAPHVIDKLTVQLDKSPPAEKMILSLSNRSCQSFPDPNTPIDLRGTSGALHIRLHVLAIKRQSINQRQLASLASIGPERIDEIFGKDSVTEFKEAFPDLAQATIGRTSMDFPTLAPQIFAEAARGGDAFDAFGVKFPSEQVTRWGLAIIIGVQLYLVMYLRRLLNKLNPEDPGWDSPWMAMDTSLLARSMLFVSLVILPPVAGLYMMVRSFTWKSPHPFVDLYPMFVGFCISFALSLLSWKYRPKLSEPVAPAQLFE